MKKAWPVRSCACVWYVCVVCGCIVLCVCVLCALCCVCVCVCVCEWGHCNKSGSLMYGLGQWDTTLHCNVFSHRLWPYKEIDTDLWHRGRVTQTCIFKLDLHLFRSWHAWGNKFQRNCNQIITIFIQGFTFENVICKERPCVYFVC